MQKGLPPVYNKNTHLLILGSAPSLQSLKKRQYYGNKGNRFWSIIFAFLQLDDPQDYHKRLQLLLDNGIGLWDVYQSFERKGSMDHHYTASSLNDFEPLLEQTDLAAIIANGKIAAQEIEKNQLFPNLAVYPCLSTSGANNSRTEQRQIQWLEALTTIKKDQS